MTNHPTGILAAILDRLVCLVGVHWWGESVPIGGQHVSECERPGCGARDYVTERAR